MAVLRNISSVMVSVDGEKLIARPDARAPETGNLFIEGVMAPRSNKNPWKGE
jgi:hypothetical protein